MYVKPYGYNTIGIIYSGNGTPVGSAINLSTQSIVAATNSPTTIYGTGNPTITAVGNGWYRVTLQGVLAVTGGFNFTVYVIPDGTSYTSAGNGFSGVYLWGAQTEALAFQTSYIPTQASQVTRASDNASMTGTNFSSWYNQSQGTFYSQYTSAQSSSANIPVIGSTISPYILYRNSSTLKTYNQVTGASVSYADGYVQSTSQKVSLTYGTSGTFLLANGSTASSTATGIIQTPADLLIGNGYNSTTFINGTMKKLSYYPVALTATQLQALTGS